MERKIIRIYLKYLTKQRIFPPVTWGKINEPMNPHELTRKDSAARDYSLIDMSFRVNLLHMFWMFIKGYAKVSVVAYMKCDSNNQHEM